MSILLSQQGAPETITADKWFSGPVVRPIARVLPAAVMAGSLFFVHVPTVEAETVTVDKYAVTQVALTFTQWFQYQPVARPLAGPERSTPDKWQPVSNQPYPYRRTFQPGWSVFDPKPTSAAEEVTLDKYDRGQCLPRFQLRGIDLRGFVVDPFQLTQPERASQDKWGQPQSQPYPYRGRPFYAGWSVVDPNQLTLAETVSHDRWAQPQSQPRLDVRRQQWLFPSFTADAQLYVQPGVEIVTVAKWYRPVEQPYPARRKPASEGWSTVDPRLLTSPESVSADRWHPQPNAPRWDLRRNQHLYPFLFADAQLFAVPGAEVIRPDKWWQPTSQPRRDVRRAQFTYQTFAVDARTISTIRLDQWEPRLSQPVFGVKRAVEFRPGALALQPSYEFLTLDKWEQRLTHPYPARRILKDYGIFVTDAKPRAEAVSFDRWHFQQSEPRRDVRRWQYLYPVWVADGKLHVAPPQSGPLIAHLTGTSIVDWHYGISLVLSAYGTTIESLFEQESEGFGLNVGTLNLYTINAPGSAGDESIGLAGVTIVDNRYGVTIVQVDYDITIEDV